MCLILLANRVHPHYSLVLAANRDEQYGRPTARAAFWHDEPHIYGGRDLEKGGTWLGITRSGRVAAVTNFRDGRATKTGTRSRGDLVANFLRGNTQAEKYLTNLLPYAETFNGFNLIVGDLRELFYFSNRGAAVSQLPPGIYGISNHLLDTPWPKLARGKERLKQLLEENVATLIDGLFEILADRSTAIDEDLPDTGVGIARERILSSAFIASDTYGTRASTVVVVDRQGNVDFVERSFGSYGIAEGSSGGRYAIEPAPAVST